MPTSLDDIKKGIKDLTMPELSALNREVVNRIKYLRSVTSHEKRESLEIGDIVTVEHPKTEGRKFKILDLKIVKASLEDIDTGQKIRAHISILNPVDEDEE